MLITTYWANFVELHYCVMAIDTKVHVPKTHIGDLLMQ